MGQEGVKTDNISRIGLGGGGSKVFEVEGVLEVRTLLHAMNKFL